MTAKLFSRLDFLNLLAGGAGVVAASEIVFVGLRFLAPKTAAGEFGGLFNLGDPDQFPPGSVTPVESGRFYLARLQDGGFLALYRRCTHLGCSVPYDPATEQFVCPCHGSAFTIDGNVLNSPAPRPLDTFLVSVNPSGEIIVDTAKPIQRDRVLPQDIFYL